VSLSSLLQLADTTAQEITEVRFPGAPEAWQIFLIVLMVVAFAAASYLFEPKGQRSKLKVPLAVLRAVLIMAAIAILFRPVESNEQREVRDGLVLVAVDTSRSMGFQDREKDEDRRAAIADALGVSTDRLREMDRLERSRMALRADDYEVVDALAAKNRVRLYGFDSTRRRLAEIDKLADADETERTGAVVSAMGELETVVADGQSTALGDSLQRILTDVRSERVAALVLLTDGRSNGGSINAEAVAARFGRKGVPIYAVGVGDPDPPRDLSVDDFRAPDVTLAGDVMRGSVLVRAQGYSEPREVRVRIKLDDLQVAEETVLVGGDRPEWEYDFSTKIERAGEYTLEASVEPDPDELTSDNNRAIRRVRVIDERIRVLYVEGYPRWEYRYLKNALIRDSHMQVQCLLLSADPQYHQEHTEGVPALTRLPSRDELLEYHVVLLGDVNPEARDRRGNPVFYDGALAAIRDLVKERGGGLLMISGEQSAPRDYANTPIADVLPVQIDERRANQDFSKPWRPRLTREGRQSPLLRLERNEADNRELWDVRLSDLFWYMRSERAKPQARVLMVHPRDRNHHGNYVLAAWHRFGAGTCFWLGFDEAWRWRASVGDKYHYRFYGQIIRFLSLQSFTRAKRFFVTTDKTHYDVGEEVRIRAEVRDRDAVSQPEMQEVIVDLPDGTPERLQLKAIEGEQGKYEGVYKPIQIGVYRLRIDPGDRGSESEVAERVFEVKLPRLELQEPRMDQDGLERIARASNGGRFMRLNELQDLPEKIMPLTEVIHVGRTERQLWDQWWVIALFVGLVCLEWIGRKLCRLL